MATPGDIAKLIGRTALGDRNAFDALYAHTSAKLFGVLLRLLRDRAEAEDALQEVYIKIWQRSSQYAQSESSAMSWLIVIARYHAIDRLRARKMPLLPIDDSFEIVDKAPDPEASALASSQRAQIDECLARLEKQKANAIRGAYLEGYSYQELANKNDIPLNTMRTWLRRSLLKLKECLQE
ncbi:MAG: sigma-70 family RNA polymerase sigma factor [Cohaesibacteraceae bacterium]|nr:sigma-70 family RNA polymerase sigma factor [Cohaesibacteraceae bacterium]